METVASTEGKDILKKIESGQEVPMGSRPLKWGKKKRKKREKKGKEGLGELSLAPNATPKRGKLGFSVFNQKHRGRKKRLVGRKNKHRPDKKE